MEKGSETKMYSSEEVAEMIDVVNMIAIIQILNQVKANPENLAIIKEEWPPVYEFLNDRYTKTINTDLLKIFIKSVPEEVRSLLTLKLFQ